MKDTHNVILIIVSSKWLIPFFPEWFIISHSQFEMLYLFFSRSSKISSSRSSILNHYKVSPCVSNFSLFSLFFLFTGVLHEGYTWWFIKVLILLEVFIKILFRGAQAFFILQSGVQFFLPYHWRWYYVILDNLSSCFMIHMLLRMRYFKSTNLVIGVTLGYISPKAFPKVCCYLWCL